MAQFNILRIQLAVNYGAPYNSTRILYTVWDDTGSGSMKVYLYENDDATLVGEQFSGPALMQTDEIVFDYGYKVCAGTTLYSFTPNLSQFPYATLNLQEDSVLCAPVVCDLKITGVTVTDASSPTSTDGAISLTGTSSAPFLYFRLGDTTYSGAFTGLLPGNYTIQALDAWGCVDEVTVLVKSTTQYGVKYRIEYDSDLKERDHHVSRIDILETDYLGSINEICSGETPIEIRWAGTGKDKFTPIIPSSAVVQLLSETNYQFIEFTQATERKYKVQFYKDYGSGFELKWVGFVIPEIYEEPIQHPPYIVTITCTDGLADIESVDFPPQKGLSSVMEIITQCLLSVDLQLNINSAVDIFETNFNTGAGDDPLAQTYFETYWLKDYKCSDVLQFMLEPFGARIYQSNGAWWITRHESAAQEFAYRTFNYRGVYQSNSTYNPVKYIREALASNRLAWADLSGRLRLMPTYGNIYIDHTANMINNLFFTGRFELDDITQGFFTGWTFNIGNGVTFGAEAVGRGNDSDAALFVNFANAEVGAIGTLISEVIDFEYVSTDYINVSFEYLIYSALQLPYLRFRWQLKTSTHYLKPDGTWTATETWISEYDTDLNKFKKVEIRSRLAVGISINTLQFKIETYGNHPFDASSPAGLQIIATASGAMLTGDRRIAFDTIGTVNVLRYYRLEEGNDATSSPTILRPNDYDGSINQRVWKQTEVLTYSALVNQAKSYLLDNVKVEFFINDEDPPDEIAYWKLVDVNNRVDYEKEIQIGDLPGIKNALRLYKHFFTLSDGTPTTSWARSDYDELLPILQILASDYSVQMKRGLRNIYGTLVGDIDIQMVDVLVDTWDSDKVFNCLSLGWSDKSGQFSIDAQQISLDGDSGFTTGFSLGFRA
jgi:hypothetical protein